MALEISSKSKFLSATFTIKDEGACVVSSVCKMIFEVANLFEVFIAFQANQSLVELPCQGICDIRASVF